LNGANETTLTEVRKRIGYIFQSHNLLEALTAQQNVQMALQIQPTLPQAQHKRLATEALSSVGLEDKMHAHPSELSGGQRQRVAIARALAGQPKLILADEPTASLDRNTGREIVELLQQLARQQSVTVVLVTHDNRILDIADRILTLEDGRLSSLMNAVTSDTRHMMRLLAEDIRKGDLNQRVSQMSQAQFFQMLLEITDETKRMLEIVELLQGDAFESIYQEVISAFAAKAGDVLGAERAVLYFLDSDAQQFWTYRRNGEGTLQELRIQAASGIASAVVKGGKTLNVADTLSAESYDPVVDGEQSRTLLAAPVINSRGDVFAVVELSNKRDAHSFTRTDEKQLSEFTTPLGLLLESWWRMGCNCRAGTEGFLQDSSCASYCP
jgi:putative ABC transport system ATP-binding protein